MLEIHYILMFLLLGAFVGVIAGLLGIGGGGILVPSLTAIFLMQGIPIDNVVHLALGTTMACMILTCYASFVAHNAQGSVLWNVVKNMSVGIILGTFLATFLAAQLKSIYLAVFFSIFMAMVSAQMFLNKKPKASRAVASKTGLFAAGSVIGAISALVSIGGGSLTVPYLIWHNVDIKKAIGTSAAIGLPISITGTLGYLISGHMFNAGLHSKLAPYTFGFIYLPAVLLISIPGYFTAPLGVKLAHKLPTPILKKIFAVLLIILSLKMLTSVI